MNKHCVREREVDNLCRFRNIYSIALLKLKGIDKSKQMTCTCCNTCTTKSVHVVGFPFFSPSPLLTVALSASVRMIKCNNHFCTHNYTAADAVPYLHVEFYCSCADIRAFLSPRCLWRVIFLLFFPLRQTFTTFHYVLAVRNSVSPNKNAKEIVGATERAERE